jgi:predicted DNA-binding antitoxin AbrB/MazE fold protein
VLGLDLDQSAIDAVKKVNLGRGKSIKIVKIFGQDLRRVEKIISRSVSEDLREVIDDVGHNSDLFLGEVRGTRDDRRLTVD